MALLKPGQTVRCARCAREWVPSQAQPDDPVAAPMGLVTAAARPDWEQEDTPAAPMSSPAAFSHTTRPNVALRLAWAASIVAVLVLGWGAFAERATIMEVWPASIRLYGALGLTADH